MEADIILADYATANENGKFTLVGAGFTEIRAKALPCVHASMFLLVRIKVLRVDKGRNRVEIRLVGEKGAIFKAQADLGVNPDHKDEEWIPIPFHLQNTRFEIAGDYNLEVLINGQEVARQILRVRLIENKMH